MVNNLGQNRYVDEDLWDGDEDADKTFLGEDMCSRDSIEENSLYYDYSQRQRLKLEENFKLEVGHDHGKSGESKGGSGGDSCQSLNKCYDNIIDDGNNDDNNENIDDDEDPEFTLVYEKIRRLIELREKYLKISLQRLFDNPKDSETWKLYPEDWTNNLNKLSDDETLPSKWNNGDEEKLKSRSKYEKEYQAPENSEWIFRLNEDGLYEIFSTSDKEEQPINMVSIPTYRDYVNDLEEIIEVSAHGPCKSFAFQRLQCLEAYFNLYTLINSKKEVIQTKKVAHRDFYNVRKVDTHVHHSACMNQKHLLRFIKNKLKTSADEVVLFRDGKYLTLRQVFDSLNLTAYDLSIDRLDMHAHTSDTFHRFDKFNLKYNPVGESRLRTIFLKTDNIIAGKYLAEITREVIADLERNKYQSVEWRISIYGRNIDEWVNLANWVVDNELFSPNVRWLIQIPRLFDIYHKSEDLPSFQEMIYNIFNPLFAATKSPQTYLNLHIFLQYVVGFDSVDDESKPESRASLSVLSRPNKWTKSINPPYNYWIYYLFANMCQLNHWRRKRNMNTFLLRPHCGEAGDPSHLSAAFLTCHSISHGLLLRKIPFLQYLFYLQDIGISMSPLSNNALFLVYERNPFIHYFRRGLNVSLSSDDPLQFAFTREPLMEEYAVAAQIYRLSSVDMCELARNSVIQSGFEHRIKQAWIGHNYFLPGARGNHVELNNVPDLRVKFRAESRAREFTKIYQVRPTH